MLQIRRAAVAALLAATSLVALAPGAAGASPAPDATTAARWAAGWLGQQLGDDGCIESAFAPGTPDLGTTTQAALALAAAGVGGDAAADALGCVLADLDAYAVQGGADAPAALGLVALASLALGAEADEPPLAGLLDRLSATVQPSGLAGTQDPTFDGTFRTSVAVLALHAGGRPVPASSVAWLVDQQCAEGGWTPFRADSGVPCPPVDPLAFTGPDTNSTALAVLALEAVGEEPGADAVAWLRSVRAAGGGWGFLGDSGQATDANSTGLVLTALATAGAPDAQGRAALLALQVPCDGPEADRGGVAFQPVAGELFPDALATAQATWGLAGALPDGRGAPPAAALPEVTCPSPPAPEPPPTTTPPGTTPPAGPPPTVPPASVAGAAQVRELAFTGAPTGALALGAALLAAGVGLAAAGRVGRRPAAR